ncbi:MAG: tetratricopeptide repeat protein [Labilithrix sp.]|nr:tetratricopeptide repeat protein [Labilithrix sp.]MCW5834793.1 tetratricopeptide repeat protein [Labilithrix sp.]
MKKDSTRCGVHHRSPDEGGERRARGVKRAIGAALAGVLALGIVSLASSDVHAQQADAGAPATASVGDGGVLPNLSTGDGGAAAPASAGDAGTSNVLSAAAQQRKLYPPPPPPTPQQIAALEALKQEVDAYEKGAKEYRDTVTTIIKLHYETKKKEVLSGLDREIAIEKAELKKAREIAIRRLEEFIATYSGPRSHPEATPDAMYRLAALYEERARSEDATVPLEEALKDAIRLYKRVINEFPKYREIAGIYYFLGHALNDSGRMPESQQVWRSLVCHNHFPYPTKVDPKDPEKDLVTPMPQDADEAYWTQWRRKYNNPKSPTRGNKETVYEEVYPEDCAFVAQPALRPGEDPKYVAEVWWQIGNWEFDQLDFASGVTKEDPAAVWGYNRAASAYTRGMKYKKPPLFGVALYKYAWTLFKQQRYELATREFVNLLLYTDEQEKITGDRGADFRGEAYTYIAGSLTNVDFKGPEEWEPYIMRPDILDTEPNPDRAEQKLRVAIDRVKDPTLIPQDKPWTIEVYRALAYEFRSLNQFKNAVEVYETMLQRWPMDPTAPDTQNAIAETYDQMNVTKRPGTPEHDATAQKALEARTKLANYIGNTPWVDANKDNPAAIQNAERLVRGGLRQAAAQHTNNAKAALIAASETNDPGRQIELLSRAATEYKLAATGWQGYLKQDENAPDAYESRYWNADARRNYVRIQVKLHEVAPKLYPEPSKRDIDEALLAAIEVRDSNEDDKYLDNAAFFAVDVSDVDRDLAYGRFVETRGTAGIERRDDVKFDSADEGTRNVVKDVIPPVVLQSMTARDEYVRAVPPSLDPQQRGLEYQYYVAEQYFLYGHWDVARQRYEAMWKDNCKKNEYGYKAWERLITMAAKSRNAEESLRLAEAEKNNSCAYNPEQTAQASGIIKPIGQEAAYVKARAKFEEARKAPAGPEKNRLWREAAALYEQALGAAPGRDEAPEGAMNAAYAYKQVGEYNKAIELYNRFISEYGSNERLNALQKGDPKTKAAPDPKKYAERVKYLGDAYDALGTTYYSFFNYTRAAETYEKVSANERFDEPKRRDAAKNAMILYANMGQRDKMLAEHRTLVRLHPTAEDKADADYRVASFDFKQWDPKGADSGTNRQNRTQGEGALMTYYQANRNNAGAGKYVVEAAYAIAKMKRAGGEGDWRTWLSSTVAAWDSLRARSGAEAQKPPYVDYAAEAAFTLLDDEITSKYDVASKHTYPSTVPEILGAVDANGKVTKKGKYQTNAEEAQKWDLRLENEVIKKYESLEWVPAAFARQGAIFDTLRSGLYNTVKVKLFDAQGEKVLNTMRNSGRDDLMNKADELEDKAKDFWRGKKQQELDAADEVMVRRYATSVSYARKYNVKNAAITKAIGRLAYYTDIIGDAKMQQFVTNAPDPTTKGATKLTYAPNQYVQTRPGLTALPPAQGNSNPLPAAP